MRDFGDSELVPGRGASRSDGRSGRTWRLAATRTSTWLDSLTRRDVERAGSKRSLFLFAPLRYRGRGGSPSSCACRLMSSTPAHAANHARLCRRTRPRSPPSLDLLILARYLKSHSLSPSHHFSTPTQDPLRPSAGTPFSFPLPPPPSSVRHEFKRIPHKDRLQGRCQGSRSLCTPWRDERRRRASCCPWVQAGLFSSSTASLSPLVDVVILMLSYSPRNLQENSETSRPLPSLPPSWESRRRLQRPSTPRSCPAVPLLSCGAGSLGQSCASASVSPLLVRLFPPSLNIFLSTDSSPRRRNHLGLPDKRWSLLCVCLPRTEKVEGAYGVDRRMVRFLLSFYLL